ncbi:MAG: cupin domain-containing protein [Thermodesulfobacteriota bacterium]|jgi:transcriptional regulator with XRE-family HTH domain
MDEGLIARNVKALRIKKGLSLEELSKLAGITRGYLSKIERSHRAPPLSTLNKIAITLGVQLSFLLQETTEKIKDNKLLIVRRDKGKKVITKGTLYGYEYEAIAYNKPGKNMEPFIILPTIGEEGNFKHEGEEFMYVLEGTHEFKYAGKKYILRRGDSIYFDSGVPHSGRSLGKPRAKILSVIYSYKR